jgi:hypothetical protein
MTTTTPYDNWTPTRESDSASMTRELYTREPYDHDAYAPTGRPAPAATTNSYSAGIDQVRYWVGTACTALVTGMVGLIGLVAAHGIGHIPVLFVTGGKLSPLNAASYAMIIAALALLAAALYDGLLHVAPRPTAYFSAIVTMITALAVLSPFTTTAGLHSQIAFGAMNLAAGLTILILVPLAAVNARR